MNRKNYTDGECSWSSIPAKNNPITSKEKAINFLNKEMPSHTLSESVFIISDEDLLSSYEFKCEKCLVTISVYTEGSHFSAINTILMFYPNFNATCEEILMDEACK